jgi:hypothetical protein
MAYLKYVSIRTRGRKLAIPHLENSNIVASVLEGVNY